MTTALQRLTVVCALAFLLVSSLGLADPGRAWSDLAGAPGSAPRSAYAPSGSATDAAVPASASPPPVPAGPATGESSVGPGAGAACVPGLERPSGSGVDSTGSSSVEADTAPAGSGILGTATADEPLNTSLPSVLAVARADGVCPQGIFLPRAAASPTLLERANETGTVTPLYQGIPAPIGLADYGISDDGSGVPVPSVLNTTSVRGSVDANATGIQPLYLAEQTPDAFAVQLNAVLTYVDLSGHTAPASGKLKGIPYEFWTQNVVEYFPDSRYMVLITNLWNFSGNAFLGSAIYQHGPYGQVVDDVVYEAALPIATPITYPFNLTLFLDSEIMDGRAAVEFWVQLSGPGEMFSEPYDYVVFNSTVAGGASPITPPPFTVDGRAYNHVGLMNDFELDITGPGGGSQTDLIAADANLGLAYWNATANGGAGAYVSVPSAFNFGGDTGETATGGNVAWSNAVGGVAGLTTYGTMTTGPTFLEGLWNASGPEGSYPVTIEASPSNAFEVLTPTAATVWPNLTTDLSVAPTLTTDTFWLAPGFYLLLTELSGFDPVEVVFGVFGPVTLAPTLPNDPSEMVYTPLWAWSNDQVAALSTSGSGTPSDPYVLEHGQGSPISPTFGLYNDYGFPVFPAVLFVNTSVSVEVADPSNFSTSTNDVSGAGPELPQTNDLPLWFDNVTGVALLNASQLGGWFSVYVPAPAAIVFYESSGNLVAGCTIDVLGDTGLVAYSGGTFSAPTNVGGGNNTFWGNTFQPVREAYGASFYGGTSLVVAEPNDLVYNNWFVSESGLTTASLPTVNLYSGAAELFTTVRWNITVQPSSVANYASGFPTISLAGSILGTSWQGGNAWGDYGTYPNAYGHLPYNESGAISVGGDYAPLFPSALWLVTFQTTGLPPGEVWGVEVRNTTSRVVLDDIETPAASCTAYLPNGTAGTYTITVEAPYGYRAADPTMTNLSVNGQNETFTVAFVTTFSVKFSELSLPSTELALGWTVVFNGTVRTLTSNSTTFVVPEGSYAFLIAGPSGYHVVGVPSGTITVPGVPDQNVTRLVGFLKGATGTLSFTEKGLAAGQSWCARVGGWERCTTGSSEAYPNLTKWVYLYDVVSPLAGQEITVKDHGNVMGLQGAVTVGKTTTLALTFVYPYTVTFNETGLASGLRWSATVKGVTRSNAAGESIVFALPNGTYSYRLAAKSGYTSSGSPRPVVVNGTAVTVNVTYGPKHRPSGGSPVVGLPAVLPLALAAVGARRPALPRRGALERRRPVSRGRRSSNGP